MNVYIAFATSSLLLLLMAASSGDAFVPSSPSFGSRRTKRIPIHQPAPPLLASSSSASIDPTTSAAAVAISDVRTGKPTGTSFLPSDTIERAVAGSPIEKIKLAKDGTSAFVDVYEYARKIREGQMTWEEVEKADLDTVCAT